MNDMRKLMEAVNVDEFVRKQEEEEYRLQGFHDARDGVFHPEAYAKGWARDAYRLGKDQWLNLMAQER